MIDRTTISGFVFLAFTLAMRADLAAEMLSRSGDNVDFDLIQAG